MKTIRYITISLLMASALGSTGCYEATERRKTLPLKYKTGIELTESHPELIQLRLDSLIAFMIQNEIVEIQIKKNKLRFEVVMREMKDESESNNTKFNTLLEEIELRNSTLDIGFQKHNPETESVLGDYESGLTNGQDNLVLSISVAKSRDRID